MTASTATILGVGCVVAAVIVFLAFSCIGTVHLICDRVMGLVFPTANRALKKQILVSLPTFTFSPESAVSECVICLEDYDAGDVLRLLPRCGHSFHVVCVDQWFLTHSSCPSCRQVPVAVKL